MQGEWFKIYWEAKLRNIQICMLKWALDYKTCHDNVADDVICQVDHSVKQKKSIENIDNCSV